MQLYIFGLTQISHGTSNDRHKLRVENLKPLDTLNLNGDTAENWRHWKQRCNVFVIACGEHEKDENIQCTIFLQVIGEDTLNIYDTLTFQDNRINKIVIN